MVCQSVAHRDRAADRDQLVTRAGILAQRVDSKPQIVEEILGPTRAMRSRSRRTLRSSPPQKEEKPDIRSFEPIANPTHYVITRMSSQLSGTVRIVSTLSFF
jgi:hypothetical protein